MADTKVTAFPPSAGLSLTDIFPVVDDPGGTPVTQQATFAQLQTLLSTGGPFVLKAGDTMTGALVHPLGSTATPSISFVGDLNTGIHANGTGLISFSSDGTDILNVGSTSSAFGFWDFSGADVAYSGGSANFYTTNTSLFTQHTMTHTGFDVNTDLFPFVTFDSSVAGSSVGISGFIGFFSAAAVPVTQQSAAGNTLAEVLAALRAYGLLAP